MGRKILIVDDSMLMRVLVKDALASSGFEVVGEATNGAEAVSKYNELKPDLVTMDITMGVKDGQEAAREILSADPKRSYYHGNGLGAREDASGLHFDRSARLRNETIHH
jgi:two-component system chemotaxis response regulator CheY